MFDVESNNSKNSKIQKRIQSTANLMFALIWIYTISMKLIRAICCDTFAANSFACVRETIPANTMHTQNSIRNKTQKIEWKPQNCKWFSYNFFRLCLFCETTKHQLNITHTKHMKNHRHSTPTPCIHFCMVCKNKWAEEEKKNRKTWSNANHVTNVSCIRMVLCTIGRPHAVNV